MAQDAHGQLRTPRAQRTPGWGRFAGLIAAPGPAGQLAISRRAQRAVGPQAPKDQQGANDPLMELAFTLLPGVMGTEHRSKQGARGECFQQREAQQMTELVCGGRCALLGMKGNSF